MLLRAAILLKAGVKQVFFLHFPILYSMCTKKKISVKMSGKWVPKILIQMIPDKCLSTKLVKYMNDIHNIDHTQEMASDSVNSMADMLDRLGQLDEK